MLFNSFAFLIFLPLVIFGFYLINPKYRWILLLLASYFFYGFWKIEYLSLILASTLIDFWASKEIEKQKTLNKQRVYLAISLFTNLGLLFSFKYLYFFATEWNKLALHFGDPWELKVYQLLLPVGISFYTFQTLSYTIDVFKKRIPAEKHLGYFALYVSFWPQLVAGPIERSSRLLPQLKQKVSLDFNNIKAAYIRILWGFFKKVVIADGVAGTVNQVFSNIPEQNGFTLLIGAVLFAIQIYCDFSGYSDIAIGSARLMGIKLMENFKSPYFSKSLGEFWQRWHISLSTWFRDYLYIPLGGNRGSKTRTTMNLLITFLVSGLWHGANWTFMIWGGIHGLVLVLEKLFTSRSTSFGNKLIRFITTQLVVLIAWIFFRADSLANALDYIYGLRMLFGGPISINMLFDKVDLIVWTFTIGLLFWTEWKLRREIMIEEHICQKNRIGRFTYYILMPCLILWFGTFGNTEFIYFQF